MDWTQVLLAALIAATIAAVSTVALNRPVAQATPAADETETAADTGGRHRNWWRGRTGRRFHHLCGERYNERLEWLATYAERELEMTDAQKRAWTDVVTALKDSDRALATACDRTETADGRGSAPAELARIEGLMTVGLEIVRTVRPAFERFYGTLDSGQRQEVDRLIVHGRHG